MLLSINTMGSGGGGGGAGVARGWRVPTTFVRGLFLCVHRTCIEETV